MTEEQYREIIDEVGFHLEAIAKIVRDKGNGDGCVSCWFHKDGGFSFETANLFSGWEYKNFGEGKLIHTVPLAKEG